MSGPAITSQYGKPIPVPVEGQEWPTAFSASYMRMIVTRLNALSRPEIVRGANNAAYVSDSNVIYSIKNESQSTTTTGSSVAVYKVTSIANLASDYIKAKPVTYDNSNAETLGTEVSVALPWQLRAAQVTARNPEYVVNDYIVVASSDTGIGVVVSSTQLTLVDLGIGRIDTGDIPVTVKWCKIQASGIADDYVTVKEWTGSAETGSTFNVAKPTKLRYNGGASETIDGSTVSFSSWASTTRISRTATVSGVSEKQVIVPRLQDGDIILARRAYSTGVSSASEWVDLNIDGRAWCRKYDQS